MNKIKYLIKRIVSLDYSNMFKIIKSIKNKTKKSSIYLFFDIIYCGIVYQAGYYDYQEFEFYDLNKEERKTFLTRGKNDALIKKYNNKDYWHLFDNKIEFNKIFAKFIKRDWLYLDNNIDEFIKLFSSHDYIIVKPIDDSGGKGVEKFVYKDESDAKELYKKLIKNNQLLIEEGIKQHHEMDKLYSGSVNTLRMFTFIKNGTPYYLQTVLKIGNGGVVDNFSSGGMYTYVDDEGIVFVPAIDRADNIFTEHPITHEQIKGFKVPFFKDAVELVKECSKVIPEVAYVGWDVAITENGPDIVEGNCLPGVFQVKASLAPDKKEGLLPKYREIMGIE